MVSVLPFAVLLSAPPFFVGAVIGVLATTLASGRQSPAERDHSSQPEVEGTGARLGRILVLGLGGLGSLSIIVAAGQVLAL